MFPETAPWKRSQKHAISAVLKATSCVASITLQYITSLAEYSSFRFCSSPETAPMQELLVVAGATLEEEGLRALNATAVAKLGILLVRAPRPKAPVEEGEVVVEEEVVVVDTVVDSADPRLG